MLAACDPRFRTKRVSLPQTALRLHPRRRAICAALCPTAQRPPSAILILPALVSRMPPKTSSMYPSSISRALCSDGMPCIKPLARSRNETNSSRVNGGAVGAILGICSYGGPDQAEFVATIKLVQPRPEGLASRQIRRPRLTFREQPVGRFVQTLLLAASIRQMTN